MEQLIKTLHTAFLLVILTLMYSCRSANPFPVDRVVLRPQEAFRLTSGVTVRVDTVADGRCPKNAQCIWAGNVFVSALLTKEQASGRARLLLGPNPTQKMRQDLDSTQVILGNETYKVILRSVSDKQQATIQVSRL